MNTHPVTSWSIRVAIFILCTGIVFAVGSEVHAQSSPVHPCGAEKRVAIENIVSAGVLNNKATYLPTPLYPRAARAVRASGYVVVQITVDEVGKVISAVMKSGHPLFNASALRAVRGAKFMPTKLNGVPIKVTGKLIFNFTASGKILPVSLSKVGCSDISEFPPPRPFIFRGPSTLDTTPPAPPFVADDDPAPTPPPAPIEGGILNSHAISMPRPPYPAVAKAAHASGLVTIKVTIDETGKVVDATAVSGHPLLKAAALGAARGARFNPTLIEGKPVRISGVLLYEFIAD
ncbi:MAG: TonB family protein [Pyrinomonadaceae bacterium]